MASYPDPRGLKPHKPAAALFQTTALLSTIGDGRGALATASHPPQAESPTARGPRPDSCVCCHLWRMWLMLCHPISWLPRPATFPRRFPANRFAASRLEMGRAVDAHSFSCHATITRLGFKLLFVFYCRKEAASFPGLGFLMYPNHFLFQSSTVYNRPHLHVWNARGTNIIPSHHAPCKHAPGLTSVWHVLAK